VKIAFVYDRVYPYNIGGGEKRVWELAKTLAASGHETTILTCQMWEGASTLFRQGVSLVGVSRKSTTTSESVKRSVGDIIRFSQGLGEHLLKNSYDIVECANFPYLSCLVARFAQIFNRFILVVCWFEVRGWSGWWKHRGVLGLLAATTEKLTSLVVDNHSAISELTRRRMGGILNLNPHTINVVACGADIKFISRFASKTKKIQLVTAGRLVTHKHVEQAIHTLCELHRSEPELRLLIIGRGPEENRLKRLVQSLNLQDCITFTHGLSEEELYQTYAESKIFLFPSEMEGFGIVAIEAMAAGTPVIVQQSAQSAACDLITDNQDGLLAESPEDWVTKTRSLLKDDAFYHSVRGAALKTAAAYDWPEVARRTERYFLSLVAIK